jgi:hypothetical protein
MVDLQRSMGCTWNIVRARIQAGWENSDADASPDSIFGRKFSPPDSRENFIRADLTQLEPKMGSKTKIAKTTPCKVERGAKRGPASGPTQLHRAPV